MASFLDRITRRKYVTFDQSELPRVLTLLDLTLLGIGSTVGVGFYILAGAVARDTAGPAVTISFLIAAIASIFAGLCYAEFGARVPKAGSAYIYSYVCVGEFVSFVIGWNLILEYVIGTASVARGYSSYIDELANGKISSAFENAMGMNVDWLSPYPDFFAFTMVLLLAVVVSLGVKLSTRFNNIFSGVNTFVIVYVIIAGSIAADVHNWALSEEEVGYNGNNATVCVETQDPQHPDEPDPWGTGGFAPYGVEGIMQGAATCFFGFVGFDIIATTGEEALRPERNIPLSIAFSLFFVFVAYFSMSTVITLALAYCLQDAGAPLIHVFDVNDMQVSKWIVSVGAVFGFSASLLGAIFPLPRIIYAMSSDGLLFRFLSKVNKRFQTPFIATILSGLFAAIMALLFSLESLIDMMSIGTLLAYTIVALCVMLLRYSEDVVDGEMEKTQFQQGEFFKERQNVYTLNEYLKQSFNSRGLKEPTELTSAFVNYATITFAFFTLVFDILLVVIGPDAFHGGVGAIVALVILAILVILNAVIISKQPVSKKKLSFKVPFVPWIPCISTVINLYLMCNLSSATWIRFGVWMVIGLLIYFLYGIRNSGEITRRKNLQNPDMQNKKRNSSVIPPIIIQPPTPMGSNVHTPVGSIKKKNKETSLSKVALANVYTNKAFQSDQEEDDLPSYGIYPELVKTESSEILQSSAKDLVILTSAAAEYQNDSGNLEDYSSVSGRSTSSETLKSVVNDDLSPKSVGIPIYGRTGMHHGDVGVSKSADENTTDVCLNGNTFKDLTKMENIYVQASDGVDVSVPRSPIVASASIEKESVYVSTPSDNINITKVVASQSNIQSTEPDGKFVKEDEKQTPKYEIDSSTSNDKFYLAPSENEPLEPAEGFVSTTPSSNFPLNFYDVPPRTQVTNTKSLPLMIHDSFSLPGSPHSTKKQPLKPFKRVASFDHIPPSTQESPGVRRIDSSSRTIFVIPVNDTIEQDTDEKDIVDQRHVIVQDLEDYKDDTAFPNMLNELGNKLKSVASSNERYEVTENNRKAYVPEISAKPLKYNDYLQIAQDTELDTIKERRESMLSDADMPTPKSSASAAGTSILDDSSFGSSSEVRMSGEEPGEKDILENVSFDVVA